MAQYKVEIVGDTISLYLENKIIGGKWKGKRWHAILDGTWAYQIDARHFPKKIQKDIVNAEKIAGWR